MIINESRINESVIPVSLDEDKLIRAMKKHNYDFDSYYEFLAEVYGLEDGKDFQSDSSGTSLLLRSSVPKSKIEKLKKDLSYKNSSTRTNRISESRHKYNMYDIAVILGNFPYNTNLNAPIVKEIMVILDKYKINILKDDDVYFYDELEDIISDTDFNKLTKLVPKAAKLIDSGKLLK